MPPLYSPSQFCQRKNQSHTAQQAAMVLRGSCWLKDRVFSSSVCGFFERCSYNDTHNRAPATSCSGTDNEYVTHVEIICTYVNEYAKTVTELPSVTHLEDKRKCSVCETRLQQKGEILNSKCCFIINVCGLGIIQGFLHQPRKNMLYIFEQWHLLTYDAICKISLRTSAKIAIHAL